MPATENVGTVCFLDALCNNKGQEFATRNVSCSTEASVSVELYTSKAVECLPTALHGRCCHVASARPETTSGYSHTYLLNYITVHTTMILITTARCPRHLTDSTLPIDMASNLSPPQTGEAGD